MLDEVCVFSVFSAETFNPFKLQNAIASSVVSSYKSSHQRLFITRVQTQLSFHYLRKSTRLSREVCHRGMRFLRNVESPDVLG